MLGPILFTIHTLHLGDIIKENNTDYQIYADDNELYMAFSPNDIESQLDAKTNMEQCIEDTGKIHD